MSPQIHVSGKRLLRAALLTLGYLFLVLGGFLFFCGLHNLYGYLYDPGTGERYITMRDIIGAFRSAGYFLVPGWLLLRLAAGLFPFSLKFSQKPADTDDTSAVSHHP